MNWLPWKGIGRANITHQQSPSLFIPTPFCGVTHVGFALLLKEVQARWRIELRPVYMLMVRRMWSSRAFSSGIMTFRAVHISSTLPPNANNVYSITTSLLFTPSKGLNGKYWDWCSSLYSLTLPNITSLAFFVIIGSWCSLSKACVNPKSN